MLWLTLSQLNLSRPLKIILHGQRWLLWRRLRPSLCLLHSACSRTESPFPPPLRSFCWFWPSCAPPFGFSCISQRFSVCQLVLIGSFFLFIMAFSFLTLNCCGLRDEQKRLGLLQWLRCLQSPVDFVCLQKTNCTSASEASLWFSSSGYSVASSPGSLRSCGCLVLYRPVFSLLSCRIDSDGRFLRCNFSFHEVCFILVCVYAPNRNPARNEFLDDLPSYVDLSSPTVICGDFNTVFDRSLEWRGSIVFHSSRESTRELSALFVSSCVLAIWRYLHPQCKQFT